jgi:hypothetical protein
MSIALSLEDEGADGRLDENTIEATMGWTFIDDLETSGKLNDMEIKYLQYKYKKVFEQNADGKAHDISLTKRLKLYQNDILAEKISIEKLRVDEMNETAKLQQYSEKRNLLQKELETVEQKDTVQKFELFELKKVHEDLQNSLMLMKKQNSRLVDPVLNGLKQEIVDLTEQYSNTEEAYERENIQKGILLIRMDELEKINEDKQTVLKAKQESLKTADMEPGRLKRQITSIGSAEAGMQGDLAKIERAGRNFEAEQDLQRRKRSEAEKLKKTILEKLELNRQTLEEREQDVAG